MNTTFLNPGSADEPFFGKLASFMRIAAEQLDIELEVIDCHLERSRMISEGEAVLGRSRLPEYLVMGNPDGAAVDLLPRVAEAGIKVMLVNEGMKSYDYSMVGRPRNPLANWLGQLQPDDKQAGHLLADQLLDVASAEGRLAPDGTVNMVALAGDYNWCSSARVAGLNSAVKSRQDVTLKAVRLGDWDRHRARELTSGFLELFPQTAAIWAASDLMAAGAIDAIEAAGREPGQDVLVGGVDWAPLAYDRIRGGSLAVSVGGHFMEGAWSLVMLYDHHHGRDFAATKHKSSFIALTQENLDEQAVFFDESRWAGADFARLSKVKNPAVDSYALTPQAAFGPR